MNVFIFELWFSGQKMLFFIWVLLVPKKENKENEGKDKVWARKSYMKW